MSRTLPPRGGSREGAARPQRVPPRSGLTASVAVCVRRRPPRPRLQPPASARSVCAVAQLQHAQAELCVAARGGRSWDQPRRAAFERRPPPRPRQSLLFAKNASAPARWGLSDATAVASAAPGHCLGRPAAERRWRIQCRYASSSAGAAFAARLQRRRLLHKGVPHADF